MLKRVQFSTDDDAAKFVRRRGLVVVKREPLGPGECLFRYRSGMFAVEYEEEGAVVVPDEVLGPEEGDRAETTGTLRRVLFEELEELRSGSSSPSRAKAVVALAEKILATRRLDLEFAVMSERHSLPSAGRVGSVGLLGPGSEEKE